METISVLSAKGGVGKTTTALALGAGLRKRGYKVLFVDLDPQANLTYALGTTGDESERASTFDFLTSGASTPIKDDVIISTPQLATAEQELSKTGREYRLRKALEPVKNQYDYVVIDTPPSLGILTVNALTASDSVIIPAQADIFSLQGITQIKETIEAVKEYCNHSLNVKGILLTRFNKRVVIGKYLTDMIKKYADTLETRLFNTKIRECVAIKEAQARKTDIFTYAPNSNGATDYKDFIKEYSKVS